MATPTYLCDRSRARYSISGRYRPDVKLTYQAAVTGDHSTIKVLRIDAERIIHVLNTLLQEEDE